MVRVEKRSPDYALILLLVLLIGLGLSILYSASYPQAERLDRSSTYFFIKQIIMIGVGAIAGFAAVYTPLKVFQRMIPYFLLFGFVLLLMTFIPRVGQPIMGARRWIFLFGQSFQPSELVKVALVLYLASYFSKREGQLANPVRSVLPPLIVVSVFVGFVLLQNDFSTALFLFFISILLFFVARVSFLYLALLGFIIIPISLILLFTKEHRVQRLISFFDPSQDPTDTGFQVIQTKLALADGGFWGKGLGMSTKKLGALPEAHSDFILAVIGEELGFLGVLFVLSLFLFFAHRGYSIAVRSKDPFRYYLSFGITSMILCQAILHMAVVGGLVPVTGVPLPFFSSGGSSIVMTLFMGGLLLNASRDAEEYSKVKYV